MRFISWSILLMSSPGARSFHHLIVPGRPPSCLLVAPSGPAQPPPSSMSIRDMKVELQRRGVDHRDLFERGDLERRIDASRCGELWRHSARSKESKNAGAKWGSTDREGPELPGMDASFSVGTSEPAPIFPLPFIVQPPSPPPPPAPPKPSPAPLPPVTLELRLELPEVPAGGFQVVANWAMEVGRRDPGALDRLLAQRGLAGEADTLFGAKAGASTNRRRSKDCAYLLAGDVAAERALLTEAERQREDKSKQRSSESSSESSSSSGTGSSSRLWGNRYEKKSAVSPSPPSPSPPPSPSSPSSPYETLLEAELWWAQGLPRRAALKESVRLLDGKAALAALLLDDPSFAAGTLSPPSSSFAAKLSEAVAALDDASLCAVLAKASLAEQRRVADAERRRSKSAATAAEAAAAEAAAAEAAAAAAETAATATAAAAGNSRAARSWGIGSWTPPTARMRSAQSGLSSLLPVPPTTAAATPTTTATTATTRTTTARQHAAQKQPTTPQAGPGRPVAGVKNTRGKKRNGKERSGLGDASAADDEVEALVAAVGGFVGGGVQKLSNLQVGQKVAWWWGGAGGSGLSKEQVVQRTLKRTLRSTGGRAGLALVRQGAGATGRAALALGRWAGGTAIAPEQSLVVAVTVALVTRRGVGGFLGAVVLLRIARKYLIEAEDNDGGEYGRSDAAASKGRSGGGRRRVLDEDTELELEAT